MKNRFVTDGDTTTIFLPRSGVERPCLIDTQNLALVGSISGWWRPWWSESCKTFYAVHKTGTEPSRTVVWMHNLIFNPVRPLEVDHIHHNGLDNRKNETRIVTRSINSRNKREIKSPTGLLGIYRSRNNTYAVVVTPPLCLPQEIGRFRDLELAKQVSSIARERLDGLAFPSEKGLARRVGEKLGFTRAYVSMVMRGVWPQNSITSEVELQRAEIKRQQEAWFSGSLINEVGSPILPLRKRIHGRRRFCPACSGRGAYCLR